jgi:hypothetical protein
MLYKSHIYDECWIMNIISDDDECSPCCSENTGKDEQPAFMFSPKGLLLDLIGLSN